jgi:nucleotide-binding universal stress UspA family protein
MSETIVVGYDGKDASRRALDRAIDTVKEAGGTVVAVVVEYEPVDPAVQSMYSLDIGAITEPMPAPLIDPPPEVQQLIDDAMARVAAGGVSGDYVWGFGDPGRTILDAARDHRATKIMVGAYHHGFIGRLFGDDVEAEVKRGAGCEVVVVE